MVMKKCWKILVALLLASQSFAAMHGLATKFGEVILSGMYPGMVYSMKKERKLPYTVINNASERAEVEVTIAKPTSSQLKENYEEIPDITWVKVFPAHFTLEQGEEMDCDLIISIPEEEQFTNRHFQAMVKTQLAAKPYSPGVSLAFSYSSRIRFSTGPRPESIIQEYREKIMEALQIKIEPLSFFIDEKIVPGKKTRLDGRKNNTVQVINRSRENFSFKFSVPSRIKDYGIVTEYEPVPAEVKVTIKKKKMKVKPRSISDIVMEIAIPDKEEFYGKNYAFVVVGKLMGFDIPIELFSRVYFRTEEKK